MDFLDPKKKQQHRIRLFIGYGIMGIILAFSTYFIVLATSGYGVDRSTGNIIKNGLVVVDSHPVAGNVFVNGDLSGRTVRRLVIPEGKYLIEVRQDGYRTWQREVELVGTLIEQLNYPFLFPQELQTETIANYSTETSFITQSPDRRWLVVGSATKPGAFDVIDLSDSEHPVRSISLPSDTVTPSDEKHKFELVEWSTDNQNLLVKHSWGSENFEYIVANVSNPLESLNVSKLFSKFSSFEVSLWDKKPDLFYLYNPKTQSLIQADARDKSTDVILGGVVSFKPYKNDTIIYANRDGEVRIKNSKDNYLIRQLPVSSEYLLEFAEFNRKEYLTFASTEEGVAYIYIDPMEALERDELPRPSQLLTVDQPQYLSFSNNARFIALQSGSNFAVFDAETNRRYQYDIGIDIKVNEQAYWMDGHRLTVVSGRKSHVFDFNSLNKHELTNADVLSRTYFDRDYENMFNVFSSENTKAITETKLLVEN